MRACSIDLFVPVPEKMWSIDSWYAIRECLLRCLQGMLSEILPGAVHVYSKLIRDSSGLAVEVTWGTLIIPIWHHYLHIFACETNIIYSGVGVWVGDKHVCLHPHLLKLHTYVNSYASTSFTCPFTWTWRYASTSFTKLEYCGAHYT